MTETYNWKILTSLEELKNLENSITRILSDSGIDYDIIFDVRMALHEHILNVMEHAYHWDKNKFLEVSLSIDEDKIVVKIRDFGEPMESLNMESFTKSFRGRGLDLIKASVDEIFYNKDIKDANELIFIKKLG